MKPFSLLTSLVCLVLLLAGSGCTPEKVIPNGALPLLGFGDEEGVISVLGDTLRVDVLWTRATPREQNLTFDLFGAGADPADLVVLTPSPLVVPAGATETAILLQVAGGVDTTRLDREGQIVLETNDWSRLTERDTFDFGYSVPHTVDLTLWAPQDPFPQLWGYTSFGPEPVPPGRGQDAGPHFAFAYASRTEPNVIGMYNRSGTNSTNALNMVRIYADNDVSSSSAGIDIPKLFRLTPSAPGATSGTVQVIPQRVQLTRRASSGLPPFTVGISGTGTYDETTGIISVGVIFDESELGIPEPQLRRYSYESVRRQ